MGTEDGDDELGERRARCGRRGRSLKMANITVASISESRSAIVARATARTAGTVLRTFLGAGFRYGVAISLASSEARIGNDSPSIGW